MNRSRSFLLAITVLWLATAILAYISWRDSTDKFLSGPIGRIILKYDGYPSFIQTSFFAVVLVGCFAVVLLWVGYVYDYPRFSLRYKTLVDIVAGIVFVTMGAYLLNYAWTLQQINNHDIELISKNTNPMAPLDEWQQEIDSRRILILPSASNGVIYFAIGVILLFVSKMIHSTKPIIPSF